MFPGTEYLIDIPKAKKTSVYASMMSQIFVLIFPKFHSTSIHRECGGNLVSKLKSIETQALS